MTWQLATETGMTLLGKPLPCCTYTVTWSCFVAAQITLHLVTALRNIKNAHKVMQVSTPQGNVGRLLLHRPESSWIWVPVCFGALASIRAGPGCIS